MPFWALWLGCVGLLVLRALMAAVESALSGVSELKARELASPHGRAGRRVPRLPPPPGTTAPPIPGGVGPRGFPAPGRGAPRPPGMVRFDVSRFGPFWVALAAPLAGVLLVGLLAAVFDVTARALASTAAETAALRLSWLASLLSRILGPFARVLLMGVNLVLRP